MHDSFRIIRHNSLPVFFLLTVISSGLPGCSPGSEGSDLHRFRRAREEGVQTVINTGAPKYEGELFQFEHLLTLREDEAEDVIFLRPSQFLMDEEGSFYVGDSGRGRIPGRIMVFNSDGSYSHDIGGPGEGPGEFRSGTIQSIEGGILSIYDGAQLRTTRFQVNGDLVDVTTMPAGRRIRANRYIHLDDGSMLLLNSVSTRRESFTEYVTALVIGVEGDTLWSFATEPCEMGKMAEMELGGATVRNPIGYAFGPRPSIDFKSSRGILVSDGLEAALTVIGTDGEIARQIRLELIPVPVTAEDRAIVYADGDRIMASLPESSRDFIRVQQENMPFPDYKAPWRSPQFDDAGYIWMIVSENSEQRREGGGGSLNRVLSPEGEYLGLTRLPKGTAEASRGRLLVIYEDEETEEYSLKIYNITPAVPRLIYP